MIGVLVEEVSDLLKERADLQGQQRAAQEVAKTREAMRTALSAARAYRNRAQILAQYVGPTTCETAVAGTGQALTRVEASREAFVDKRNQAVALEIVAKDLKGLVARLGQGWGEFATERLRQFDSPLALVSGIVTAQQREQLATLQQRLQSLAHREPDSSGKAAEFLQKCEEMDGVLRDVVDTLSPAVRTFLTQVGANIATLSDLTDEVLTWCREHDHGARFAIRYRQ